MVFFRRVASSWPLVLIYALGIIAISFRKLVVSVALRIISRGMNADSNNHEKNET